MPVVNRYLRTLPAPVWFLPLLLALGFALRRSVSAPPSDFAGYYYGGKALLHGQWQGAYDMTTLNDRIAADGYSGAMVSYSPFPPFTSLVFAPFLIFSLPVAKIVFNILSIAVFLISLFRLTARYPTSPFLILALPFVFIVPLLNNVAFGQGYLLLFALLAGGWLAYEKERPVAAAVLWAAAILFKLFPAFLFVFLLLKKKYRQAVYLAAACALLMIPSLWLNGIASWKLYLSVILPRMAHGELNDSFTYIFQSAFMLLKRAFRYDGLLNPHPVVDSSWLFVIGVALFKAAILTPAIRLTLRCKEEFLPFTVWVMASMLISPNGSSYSLVLLIFPLLSLGSRVKLAGEERKTGFPLVCGVVLLTAVCAVPVTSFGRFPLLLQFPRLYLMVLSYCLLVLDLRPHGRLLPGLALFAAISVFFIVPAIPVTLPANDPGSYVLTSEGHLFICDYSIRDHRLVYTWRDDKGRHQVLTGLPILSMTEGGVELRNNQIWYQGRQLTHSPDRKAHPTLINGSEIYYLSDAQRGFGFFTLRKLRPDEATPDAAAIPGSSR